MRIILPFLVVLLGTAFSATAQCGTGLTQTSLNWDELDYLSTSGYNNAEAIALSPKQNFAFGKNRLNIQYTRVAPNAITSAGENASHTGEAGGYGTGQDVQFAGNGTITLTFDSEVSNLQFSLYDIDYRQRVQISARNAANVQQTVAVTPLGTTILTVAGNNGTSPVVSDNTGGGTVVAATSPDASVNVDIAGPVKTVTLTVSNTATVTTGNRENLEDGSYWLSDLKACSPGSFPADYNLVSRPLSGQPAYILEAVNNSVYYVDPATGNAKLLFTDGATSAIITSMGYDPYNHVIYYVYGLVNNGASPSSSNKSLMKYDVTTGAITTLVADINATLGVPTFDQGVENGGACFYDGAWYIGIEGAQAGVGNPQTSNGESVIWRIDFNSSGVPVTATQVYGTNGDTNDWGDFAINNGTLYSFNAYSANAVYNHYNLQTGANQATPFVTTKPAQCAVGWDGTIYWLDNTVAPYNLDGTIGAQKTVTGTPAITNWSNYGRPLFNDGGEAFRPSYDFGDAPTTYDPALTPAMHETSTNLRFGSSADWEWEKTASLQATADGVDENGVTFLSTYLNGTNFTAEVQVYNNTNAAATVCAWLDFNQNGIFDPTEGLIQNVLSSTGTQTLTFVWNSVPALPANSGTYLRVRITSAANNMTVNNPTGFYVNGEVEDHFVVVNPTTLAVQLSDFTAHATIDETVALSWVVHDEEANTHYEMQKSADGRIWSSFYALTARAEKEQARYVVMDKEPFKGVNYYRLKIIAPGEAPLVSEVRKVVMAGQLQLQIAPNPASGSAVLSVQVLSATTAQLRVADLHGRVVLEKRYSLQKGTNQFVLPLERLSAGLYHVAWYTGEQRQTQPLIIRK